MNAITMDATGTYVGSQEVPTSVRNKYLTPDVTRSPQCHASCRSNTALPGTGTTECTATPSGGGPDMNVVVPPSKSALRYIRSVVQLRPLGDPGKRVVPSMWLPSSLVFPGRPP